MMSKKVELLYVQLVMLSGALALICPFYTYCISGTKFIYSLIHSIHRVIHRKTPIFNGLLIFIHSIHR